MLVLVLALAAGCGPPCPPDTVQRADQCVRSAAADPAGATRPDDTGAEPTADDVCTQPGPAAGRHEGTVACAGGVCEIEAGSFVMGRSDPAAPDRCPAREVSLRAFALDQTEVTRAAWQSCVDAGGCAPLPACPNHAPDVGDPEGVPATCVTWTAAAAYCAWAGGRLPTEAEWERVARGRGGATFPWGEAPPTCDRANHHAVTEVCAGGPVEVGQYPGGDAADGPQDLAGNVFEWTADWYDAEAYREAADIDPVGPSEGCRPWVGGGAGPCTDRVLRGGAWNTREDALAGSARAYGPPDLVDANVGFRCAWDR